MTTKQASLDFKSAYMVVLVLSILALMFTVQPAAVYASSNNDNDNDAYDSGRDHGCDDAKISDPDDRYINQPGKGPSFHTDAFMDGYYAGYNSCGGGGDGDSTVDEQGAYDEGYNLGYNDYLNGLYGDDVFCDSYTVEEDIWCEAYINGYEDGQQDASQGE